MTFSEQMWAEVGTMIPWVGHKPECFFHMALQIGEAGSCQCWNVGSGLFVAYTAGDWEALVGAAIMFACPASILLLLQGTHKFSFGGSISYPLPIHVVQVGLTIPPVSSDGHMT